MPKNKKNKKSGHVLEREKERKTRVFASSFLVLFSGLCLLLIIVGLTRKSVQLGLIKTDIAGGKVDPTVTANVWDGNKMTGFKCSNEKLSSCLAKLSAPTGITYHGVPQDFNPTQIYSYDIYGDGKYSIAMWQSGSDGRAVLCFRDECTNGTGFWQQGPPVHNLPYSFYPQFILVHDLNKNNIDHIVFFQGNKIYAWDDQRYVGNVTCSSGNCIFDELTNASVGLPSSFLPVKAEYNSQENKMYVYDSGGTCYSSGYSSSNTAGMYFEECEGADPTVTAKVWDGNKMSGFECSNEKLSSCLAKLSLPTSLTYHGVPQNFNPTQIYTHDIYGDGKYSIALWQPDGKVMLCFREECTDGTGFREMGPPVHNLSSGFYPKFILVHDLNKNNIDHVAYFKDGKVYAWDDQRYIRDTSCSSGNCVYDELTNASVGLPSSFLPVKAEYNSQKNKMSIYDSSGTCYSSGYSSSNTAGMYFEKCESEKYSISGTISGIVKQGVKITCGSYSATSNSAGTYTIANVPDKTSCTLTPSYSDGTDSIYKFTPTSYSISISSANITGKNFSSMKGDPEGDCSDLGKGVVAPLDQFDLSDISELEKIFLELTEGEGKDINGDGKFSYADVIYLISCYNCLGDWEECEI